MSRFNLEGNCNQKNVNEDGKFFNENLLGHNFTLKKKDNFGSKATLIQWQNDKNTTCKEWRQEKKPQLLL